MNTSSPTHRTPRWKLVGLASVLLLAACGPDDPAPKAANNTTNSTTGGTTGGIADVAASPEQPYAIGSAQGCALDADCALGTFCFQGTCASQCSETVACGSGESCSERGRCEVPNALEPASPDVLPGARLVNPPTANVSVKPGQTSATITITLNSAAPAAGVAVLVERDDMPDAPRVVQRLGGGADTFTLEVPTGAARPDGDAPKNVRVQVTTAAGSFGFTLVPEPSVGGRYAGAVQIDTFGSTGLPLELEIITRPVGATLADADEVWLALPVRDDYIFSPARGADAPAWAFTPLTYDAFTQSWVATTAAAFDMGDDSVLKYSSPTQVQRALRFEIQAPTSDEIFGVVRDRWTGLHEERSAEGVLTPAEVVFEGTFSARFVSAQRALAEVPADLTLPAASPGLLPAPPTDACQDAMLAYEPVVEGPATRSCQGITTLAEFAAADAAAQASCALGLSRTALAGETTGKQITAFLNDEAPGGESFEEFMQRCATGQGGACQPAPELLCSRQLLANAFRAQTGGAPVNAALVTSYAEVSREVTLGQLFGAYQSDVQTRLEWLQATDYPAVVTAAVRDKSEQLLDSWKAAVLDVHFGVIGQHLDPAGLVMLTREIEGADAQEKRLSLLMDISQGYRGGLDALTLAAQRWDALYTDAEKRREKAAVVTARARDAYLVAGILKNLNRSGGAGFLSGSIGSGFAQLTRSMGQLAQPFNKLIYARDGEVVINTSVDPTVSNATLLASLQADAEGEIKEASDAVGRVISEAQLARLNETTLRQKLNNESNDLRDELIRLCGQPQTCSIEDVGAREGCAPKIEPGSCGFLFKGPFVGSFTSNPAAYREQMAPLDPAGVSTSEGGRALLSVIDAVKERQIVEAEGDALGKRLSLKRAAINRFAAEVNLRANKRNDTLRQLKGILDGLSASTNAEVKEFALGMEQRRANQVTYLMNKREAVDKWYQAKLAETIVDTSVETVVFGLQQSITATGVLADTFQRSTQTQLDAVPNSVDDPFSAVRAGVSMAGFVQQVSLRNVQRGLQIAAETTTFGHAQVKKYRQLEFDRIAKAAEVDGLEREEELRKADEDFQKFQLEQVNERQELQSAAELLKTFRADWLAGRRDQEQLDSMRDELKEEQTKLAALALRVSQAQTRVLQRTMDYALVTQRAELVNGRWAELQRQRGDINRILGSPAAVFARANKVTQAENRLERAKGKLFDWLVALEYYAVRPFMDQRIQILLARNPYQLEEIAEKLKALQGKCGGATNTQISELSLRRDLLNITQTTLDEVGQTSVTPPVRLRQLMSQGYVPVDRRVRYTTNATVGQLLSRESGVWAVSFDVDLDDFANLGATCNAKVASVAIKLVGELGDAQPTVSVLYDGTGALRSCQPGIDEYVEQFGTETTAFGAISQLRSRGRAVSPVAGIGEFPQTTNTTLAGLPLASQYTVLIDTNLGENASLDWSRLEDVELRLEYTYQDPFPAGQCE